MTREEFKAKYWFLEIDYKTLMKGYYKDLSEVKETPDKIKLPLDVEI